MNKIRTTLILSVYFTVCSLPAKGINYTEFVCTFAGPNGKQVNGDDGLLLSHKGKIYCFLGDSYNEGKYSQNGFGVTSGRIEDGFEWRLAENGAFKPINPNAYTVSVIPFGAISLNGNIYVFCTHMTEWGTDKSRGLLLKSEDDGETFQECWIGEFRGKYQEVCPVLSQDPRTGEDMVYLFWNPIFRRSPIFLSMVRPEDIEDVGKYMDYRYKDTDWMFPVIDARTSEFSVIKDPISDLFIASYWEYKFGEPQLVFRTAKVPWRFSDPIVVWDEGYADWFASLHEEKLEEYNDKRIEKMLEAKEDRIEELLIKLETRNPRQAAMIKESIKAGHYDPLRKRLAPIPKTPYSSYMLAEINDKNYIYVMINLWKPYYSLYLIKVNRKYIFGDK